MDDVKNKIEFALAWVADPKHLSPILACIIIVPALALIFWEYVVWAALIIGVMIAASIGLCLFAFILCGVMHIMFKYVMEPIMDFWQRRFPF